MLIPISTAILSVSDKSGLLELARGLAAFDVEMLSTGGTARALRDGGIAAVSVSDYTGAPEIFGGRVKTLHPKIHGGLLARRDDEQDAAEMTDNDIRALDLVVVNLYPFRETVRSAEATFAHAVENIDIGGPTMIRAAAKNHQRVAVVVDPGDYPVILRELREQGGALSMATRFRLAQKAFAHTAAYDAAISEYLSRAVLIDGEPSAGRDQGSDTPGDSAGAIASADIAGAGELSSSWSPSWRRVQTLRYGENPHQRASFYAPVSGVPAAGPSLAQAEVLQGKELSYNNFLDIDAALASCAEFEKAAAVVVKHGNPCGVAVAREPDATIASIYERARSCDPTSAFGGIVAVNRTVDGELAESLAQTFLECVIAPDFDAAARERLGKKSNLRLLSLPWPEVGANVGAWTLRSVAGGLLVQESDAGSAPIHTAKVVSKRPPTEAELNNLDFAWRVCKHVKSNAIVVCRDMQTVGIGAGQMSRVDSVNLARVKSVLGVSGGCAASDAFFPFRDGVDGLAEGGVRAIVQPGGSKRDDEVIAAADEHGLALVFTGMRHFRH